MNLDLKRAYEAAEEIAAARTEITLPLLKAFSSLVMRNTGALYRTSRGEYDEAKGDLRLQNVSAGRGGRSYLSWEKVEPRTNDFIVWLNERLASIGSMAAPDIYDLSFEAHFRLVSGVSPPVGKKVGRCRNKDLQEVVELHVVDGDALGDILDEAGEQGRERCPEREYHDSDNDVEPPVQAHECLHLARVSFRERRVEGVVQDERKGWAYAWEAIQTAHDGIGDLSVRMFGTYQKPPSMPSWVHYTRNASEAQLRHIYSSTSAYACASINEGFGLTCVEAMACGCALVVTDFEGSREYAVPHVNALVSPVADTKAMAENLVRVLTDTGLRGKLASAGMVTARTRGWDEAVAVMERTLEQ